MRYLTFVIILSFTLNGCSESTSKENDRYQHNSEIVEKSENSILIPSSGNVGKLILKNNSCRYNDSANGMEITLSKPKSRELNEIRQILSFTGLPSNFQIFEADINNAIATLVDGQRYIIYDPSLLSDLDNLSSSYWSSMSILAHEIGHHLSGHTLENSQNPHLAELQADRFSGHVLYKMGASLEEAIVAMKLVGSDFDSKTHPSKKKRIKAISDGWNEANTSRHYSAIPPPPNEEEWLIGRYFNPGALLGDTYWSSWNNEIDMSKVTFEEFRDNHDFLIWVSDKWEGYITEVEKSRSGINIYSIYIKVKDVGKDINNNYGPFIDEEIHLTISDYRSSPIMGNAGIGNLMSILEPGRRIQFGFLEQGSRPNRTLIYLKYLKYAEPTVYNQEKQRNSSKPPKIIPIDTTNRNKVLEPN